MNSTKEKQNITELTTERICINFFDQWKRPINIINNIKSIPKVVKTIYQRMKYGISYTDCWDLDSYLISTLKNGLAFYKKDNIGYPGVDEANTFEKWNNVIDRMYELLKIIEIDPIDCEEACKIWREDGCYDKNDWMDAIESYSSKRLEAKKELSELLVKWFDYLWW